MNKKVISSVLAGAMAVSTMSVAASAADNKTTESNNAITAKASIMEATINANIPAELETFINPYGAQVSTTTTDNIEAAIKYSDGLISPTYKIENLDNSAGLKVNATATIAGSSTVTVMTKPMDDIKLQKATEKQVFAFLNTTTDNAGASKPVFASTSYTGNDQQVAFTEDGTKAADIMTINKAAAAGTADVGATGWFYVGGQCTPNPETAWDSKDTVTLNLVLDLVPSAGEKADLTLKTVELISGKAYADFVAGTYNYTIPATGSKTKAAQITFEANAFNTNVYVKYNGKLTTSTTAVNASATTPGIALTAGTASVNGKAVVTPLKDGTPAAEIDYKAGDVLEFIVINNTTNESTTYTFTFE